MLLAWPRQGYVCMGLRTVTLEKGRDASWLSAREDVIYSRLEELVTPCLLHVMVATALHCPTLIPWT